MLFFVEGNRLKIRKLGFRGKKKDGDGYEDVLKINEVFWKLSYI